MLNTLLHIIENAAEKWPENEAFRCGQVSLSYAELKDRTDSLATYLVNAGVNKGDRVGIYMNRCLETAIAVYGIMKSGAAYVPLDAMAPHERTVFLLNDCGIEFLVTTTQQTKRLRKFIQQDSPLKQIIGLTEEISLPVFSWDAIFDIEVSHDIPVEISSTDLAYIMYTSGSTGAPKGIMHTHSSGLAYAKLSADLYDIQPEDRVANHAPLHFDISTFGYFSAPLRGAATVIISDAHTKLPVSLAELMQREKLTIWYSVPLALIQLHLSGALHQYDLSSLRWVIYGGENFTVKYLRELMLLWPNAKFSNSYGPAEVNQCTYHHLEKVPELDELIPIGKVWKNTMYKILDSNNKSVNSGEVGELVIKSATRMKGYWNNAELTARSFYKDENGNDEEDNIYFKTGDLVKEDENKNLLFLGRNDRMVKVRGYRIELDEVEAVLKRHESIKEAVLSVLHTKETGEKKLVAGVILTSNAQSGSDELLRFCKMYLPIYAVPHEILILKDFPRTSSGKIDLTAIKDKLIAI